MGPIFFNTAREPKILTTPALELVESKEANFGFMLLEEHFCS